MKSHSYQPMSKLEFLQDIESSLNRYGTEHPGMSPALEQKCIAALAVLLEGELPKLPEYKTVTIIGAGISGLFASWLLARNGFRVSIHEQSQTLDGGRCNTFAFNHEDGTHQVAPGAMRIPDDFTKSLFGRLGLTTKEFKNETANSCIITNDGHTLPYTFVDRVLDHELSKRWEEELDEIRALLDEGSAWSQIVLEKDLHKLTSKQFLLSQGWVEKDVENWLAQGFGVGGYKCWDAAKGGNVAAFEIIRDHLMCYPGKLTEQMVSLNNMLEFPQALYANALKVGVQFQFGSGIQLCDSSENQIQLTNHENELFHTDYAIDTAPPKAASGIHLTTARKIFLFVEHNNRELQQFDGKCLMQSKVRRKFAKLGIGELYIQQATPECVIFMGYSWGREAKAYSYLSDELLAQQMYSALKLVFAELLELKQFHVKTWNQAFRMSSILDDWYPFEGNYESHFSKGKNLQGIFSAGDWCSPDTGFIRGALAKALHAVVSIINRSHTIAAAAHVARPECDAITERSPVPVG